VAGLPGGIGSEHAGEGEAVRNRSLQGLSTQAAIGALGLPDRIYRFVPKRLHEWTKIKRHDLRLRAGQPETLVPEEELKRVYRDALLHVAEMTPREELGDYLEFGVYTGTSLACMHEVLSELELDHVRLFGFDSFEGLPAAAGTEGKWPPGLYRSSYDFTRANLTEREVDWARVALIKGWFDDTLTPETRSAHNIRKASVIMVDCDLYSSATTALEFCAPLIGDRAVVLFDDWHPDSLAARNEGEKRAFDEFLARHPYFSITEMDTYRRESKVFSISRRGAARAPREDGA
jgi:O-methyltransferase